MSCLHLQEWPTQTEGQAICNSKEGGSAFGTLLIGNDRIRLIRLVFSCSRIASTGTVMSMMKVVIAVPSSAVRSFGARSCALVTAKKLACCRVN